MTKPATPLPWQTRTAGYGRSGIANTRRIAVGETDNPQDAAYIARACNAYPKLVEALRDTLDKLANVAVADATPDERFCQVEYGNLLRELGEQ